LRIAASQLQLLAHCLDLIDVQPRIAFCPQRSTGPQEDDYQYVDPLEIFFIFYFLLFRVAQDHRRTITNTWIRWRFFLFFTF
jgi:hypothetical protein